MLIFSRAIVALLALIPIFSYAIIGSPAELPKATPVIKVVPIKYSKEYNINAIKEAWGLDAEIGLAIAKCESGYSNLAVNYEDSKLNGHVSRGLFQLSEIHGKNPSWWVPSVNAEIAYSMYLKNGSRPWYNCSVALGYL